MKNYLAILLLVFVGGCSGYHSAKVTSSNTENIGNANRNTSRSNKELPSNKELSRYSDNSASGVREARNLKLIRCDDLNTFSLEEVEDPSRNIEETITVPKVLNIVAGSDVLTAIKIPTQSDANGFSLNWAKKTKDGFEISIEYGSRYHYQKKFDFICSEGNLYLYKVKREIRDKNYPENWDKPDEKEIQLKPPLPIEKFSIFDYLGND